MDYTTDEIVQTLSEMGFSAEPDALEELRQELSKSFFCFKHV